jgi:hypothetical protein
MPQTIDLPDELMTAIEQYLQAHPDLTLSTLIEEALTQKFTPETITLPSPEQIEKFMALSGIVQTAPHHSDEHAEDQVA